MMEVWKDIKGYEGLYQVSNLGRVKSLDYKCTGKERLLSAGKGKDGYLHVVLCKDRKKKTCSVHRLAAEAFIPNPYGLPQVNHKDEIKTNNVVTNLEWCDNKYNSNYGTRNERISKPVYQYTKDGSLVRSYPSAIEAERKSGYHQGHISACCLGKRKQHKGFIWTYTPLIPKGQLF